MIILDCPSFVSVAVSHYTRHRHIHTIFEKQPSKHVAPLLLRISGGLWNPESLHLILQADLKISQANQGGFEASPSTAKYSNGCQWLLTYPAHQGMDGSNALTIKQEQYSNILKSPKKILKPPKVWRCLKCRPYARHCRLISWPVSQSFT